MTPLLPTVFPGSIAAPQGQLPPIPARAQECSHPRCDGYAIHRHHAVGRSWQRSHLGHVNEYLEIDGQLVFILVDLCGLHHEMLESGWGGCRARLLWHDDQWLWYNRSNVDLEFCGPGSIGLGKLYWLEEGESRMWFQSGVCKGEYAVER